MQDTDKVIDIYLKHFGYSGLEEWAVDSDYEPRGTDADGSTIWLNTWTNQEVDLRGELIGVIEGLMESKADPELLMKLNDKPVVLQRTEIHHWFYSDRDEYGEYVYEWIEGQRNIAVWPKGAFKHQPEAGSINLLVDPLWTLVPKELKTEIIAEVINKHESGVWGWPDNDVDYYTEPEL